MAEISIIPLGAGQDVGRSCIILTMGGKRVMLDCGMHMGYNDSRKYPDFSFITSSGRLTEHIDCVIISHFHLDHCGSLPYMSEVVGYDGPIYMTSPTRAISPILIEDMRRILAEKKSEPELFTSEMIKDCFQKVIEVNLHEVVKVDDELEIKAYYAGHVLGAAMFLIKVGKLSAVYTGDFNMTSDCHLGAAWIDRCRPDVLISESTYATTIRESRRCRENDFLNKVHQIVENGGKVLIPVFALGRAQELCLLLEEFWERKNLKVPIYMTTGMAEKAVNYYKLFITWTNQRLKRTFYKRNSFEFKHCCSFERSMVNNPGPMIVLASPGMLHAGTSLYIFKKWAADPNNAVILPGYCTAGTIGHKLLTGQKRIENDERLGNFFDVNMQVFNMSFSAHADAVGILRLIDYCRPKKAVVFVHGEADKMKILCDQVSTQFHLDCFYPGNGENLLIGVDSPSVTSIYPKRSISKLKAALGCRLHGCISLSEHENYPIRISTTNDTSCGNPIPHLTFSTTFSLVLKKTKTVQNPSYDSAHFLDVLRKNITANHPQTYVNQISGHSLSVESVVVLLHHSPILGIKNTVGSTFNVSLSWNSYDQDIADALFKLIHHTFNQIA